MADNQAIHEARMRAEDERRQREHNQRLAELAESTARLSAHNETIEEAQARPSWSAFRRFQVGTEAVRRTVFPLEDSSGIVQHRPLPIKNSKV